MAISFAVFYRHLFFTTFPQKAGKLLVCDAVFGLYMLDLEKVTIHSHFHHKILDDDDQEVEENRIRASQQLERVEYTQLLPPDLQVDGKVHKVDNKIIVVVMIVMTTIMMITMI